MIEEFLKFQERMDAILKQAYGNDDSFRFAMKSAFEHAINARPNKPAELLARYVDRKMRGEKGLDDVAVETILGINHYHHYHHYYHHYHHHYYYHYHHYHHYHHHHYHHHHHYYHHHHYHHYHHHHHHHYY